MSEIRGTTDWPTRVGQIVTTLLYIPAVTIALLLLIVGTVAEDVWDAVMGRRHE